MITAIKIQPGKKRTGMTLVEVSIATLIIGVLIVPTMMVMASVSQSYYRAESRDRAFIAANRLLSEILGLSYDDPQTGHTTFGPESDEADRSQFDDIDDYAGWTESNLQQRDGNLVPGMEDYARSVKVNFVTLIDNEIVVASGPTDLKQITVTVTTPLKIEIRLSSIRYRNGILNQQPTFESSVIQQLEVDLTTENNDQFIMGSELLNQLPEQ